MKSKINLDTLTVGNDGRIELTDEQLLAEVSAYQLTGSGPNGHSCSSNHAPCNGSNNQCDNWSSCGTSNGSGCYNAVLCGGKNATMCGGSTEQQ